MKNESRTLEHLSVMQHLTDDWEFLITGETEKVRKVRERVMERLRRKHKAEAGDNSDDSDDDGGEEGHSWVSDNQMRTPMERWEASLMASTSLSQVYYYRL